MITMLKKGFIKWYETKRKHILTQVTLISMSIRIKVSVDKMSWWEGVVRNCEFLALLFGGIPVTL